MPPLVTRFAPSPTGHLHIGGARTALFCWAFARRHGGRFMIRIEDTDQARSSDESARGILDDLAWLGIEWDDGPVFTAPGGRAVGASSRPVGPYFQAQRIEIYNAYIEHLVRCGRAYPAFETTQELDAQRKAAVAAKATFKYPRPADVAASVFNQARWERATRGEPHVVRFLMPPTEVLVRDDVLGDVRFAAGEVDDFVIRKADGFPTYHFAVVIDDELMGVTHVLRAQEHLMNTPRHVAMQQALTRLVDDRRGGSGSNGTPFTTPVYAHLPLITNMDASKMSKRDKAKAARAAARAAIQKNPALTPAALASEAGLDPVALQAFLDADSDAVEIAERLAAHLKVALPEIEIWDFRRSGYLPGAITNFISLLGWSPGQKTADGKDLEKFDTAFLGRHFGVERVGKTSARFDRVKLMSFNADALAALGDDAFVAALAEWARQYEPGLLSGFTAAQLRMLAPALKPRCRVLRDAVAQLALFAGDDEGVVFDPKAVEKHLRAAAPGGREAVAALRAALGALAAFEAPAIDAAIESLAAGRGLKIGDVAQPARVALTGGTVSPPLGITMAVFGRERVLRRMDRALALA
ncbi:MAG: glutamate--tRNA ligase [Phycisphaerales bacterium]